MHSLKTGGIRVRVCRDQHTSSIPSESAAESSLCQSIHGLVCDVTTFHETDPLQLGQQRQPLDGLIRQVGAASKVNVTDSVAVGHQPLDTFVCDLSAVTEVNIVQILPESRNRVDGNISDQPTFLQYQVAKARCDIHNLLDGRISEAGAGRQVKDPQMLEYFVRRNAQESIIINELAVRETKFAQAVALDHERCDGSVPNLGALVQIDLQDVRAMFSECVYGIVADLHTLVEFELQYARRVSKTSTRPTAKRTRKRTLLIYLQFCASVMRLSLEMFSQPEMFSPCRRLQFSAMAFTDFSVMCLSLEMSRARSDELPSTKETRPESVRLRQLVRVKRSTRVHTERGCTLPSLTSSARLARLSLLMKSR